MIIVETFNKSLGPGKFACYIKYMYFLNIRPINIEFPLYYKIIINSIIIIIIIGTIVEVLLASK